MATQRIRSTSSAADPVSCFIECWSANGGCANPMSLYRNSYYDESSTYVPMETIKTTTDYVTPGFRRLSREGQIINNPFSSSTVTWYRQHFAGWRDAQFISYTDWCTDHYAVIRGAGSVKTGTKGPGILGTDFLSAPDVSPASLSDAALTAAYAKVSTNEAQGLVILAEGNETIRSLISLLRRFVRMGKALRKWDVNYIRRSVSARKLSDLWMEGRYFIRPLMYDLGDCIKAFKKSRVFYPHRQTFRSGRSASAENIQDGVIYATYPGWYEYVGRKTSTTIVSVRSGVLAALDAISEASIWGLDQPFDALWELVPFSFVVDWFFNVAKTIASWSPRFGIRTLTSWVTVDTTVSQGIFHTGFHMLSPPVNVYENAASGSGAFVLKVAHTRVRTPNPSRPILPTFEVHLDAAKLLDLAIWGKRYFL